MRKKATKRSMQELTAAVLVSKKELNAGGQRYEIVFRLGEVIDELYDSSQVVEYIGEDLNRIHDQLVKCTCRELDRVSPSASADFPKEIISEVIRELLLSIRRCKQQMKFREGA